MAKQLALTELGPGKRAVVVAVEAGRGLTKRLEALGVRVGQEIEKVSGSPLRGPVTVRAGNILAAIGFCAAAKIMVELKDQSS